MMASLNSKHVHPYKETAKPFQLFAPQGDDYLYHGLNFAAYGGPLAKTANNLFYPGGDMLLKNNAVNPLMQYVYGPEYEEIVRKNRSYVPSGNIVRNKPRYNIKQEADVIANTARPTQRNINRKRTSESPTRKDREQ